MKAAASRGLRRSVPVASVSLCRVERVVIAACQSAIIAKSSLASSASVSSRSVGSRMRLSTGSPAVVASAILCSCEMRADLTCLIVSSAVPRIALSAGVPSLRPYAMNTAVVARGMVHPVTLSSATPTQLRNGSAVHTAPACVYMRWVST